MEIVRPVDCDFLLRAVAAGCTFASTRRITVHKFAAGQRYLSYRFPSSAEQEAMLANFADPLFEAKLLTAILARAAAGAKMRRSLHGDYSQYAPGQRFRAARRSKGLDGDTPLAIDRSTCLPLDTGPAALDWEAPETDPKHVPAVLCRQRPAPAGVSRSPASNCWWTDLKRDEVRSNCNRR